MPVSCCIPGCSNRSQKGGNIRLFSFPKDDEVARQWLNNIDRKNPESGSPWKPGPGLSSRVCSKHFVDGYPTKENPYPTKDLGHGMKKWQRRRKNTTGAVPAVSAQLQEALSTTSPSHRQLRMRRKAEEAEKRRKAEKRRMPAVSSPDHSAVASSTAARRRLTVPDSRSPVFSPSGARIFYQGGGLKVKEPTPQQHPYRDPTNPTTPDTGRRKRLATEAAEQGKKKRRRLATVEPGQQSPPLQMLTLAGEGQSTSYEEMPMDILNETFTESDTENIDHGRKRPASAPLVQSNKEPAMRRHSSLSSLTEVKRTQVLLRYITE